MTSARVAFLAALVPFFGACSSKPEASPPAVVDAGPDYDRELPPGAPALVKVDPSELPDLGAALLETEGLDEALRQSEEWFTKPSSRNHYPMQGITHAQAAAGVRMLRELIAAHPSAGDLRAAIAARFDVYRSYGCDAKGTVLFTGYCRPIYDASLVREGPFQHPLYQLPPDLVKGPDGTPLGRQTATGLEPWPGRREIEERRLFEGTGLELVWLKSPLEAYIVHVQGSARLRLPDGRFYDVGYAGKTDRPYSSLGQALVRDGKVPRGRLSLQAIKDWAAGHPAEVQEYLWQNESYVFFQESSGGPFGSIGVAVTPRRSLATDKAIFPRGALCLVDTKVPRAGEEAPGRPFRSFVLDQDTGGAIRAAGRGDLFLGTGPEAEKVAGHTLSEGRLYYLVAKEAVPPQG
jgi:membrane-bound lytic murein transglycosylase A